MNAAATSAPAPDHLPDTGERVVPEYVREDDGLACQLYSQHLERYRVVARQVQDRSVLDLACGAGFGTRVLAEAGAREVVGIDCDPAAIDYAASHYGDGKIVFRAGTVDTLPPARFDVIACLETLEHVASPEAFLKALVARLAPQGTVFVSATTVPTRLLYRYHLHDFDEAGFAALIEASGLRIDSLLRQQFHATPRMIRRSIALHRQAAIPRYLFKTPVRFAMKLISACFISGISYRNVMAECKLAGNV